MPERGDDVSGCWTRPSRSAVRREPSAPRRSFSHAARSFGLLRQQRPRGRRRRAWARRRWRGPCACSQREAHHRLVDRADLLHVERAVGEALAVEDRAGSGGRGRRRRPATRGGSSALAELPVRCRAGGLRGTDRRRGRRAGRGAAGSAGRRGRRRRGSGGRAPAAAPTRRSARPSCRGSAPASSRSRSKRPDDRVVPLVDVAWRHQAAVLGVEDEDEAHQRGEQAAVDLVRVLAQHLAAAARPCCRRRRAGSRGAAPRAPPAPARRARWRPRSGTCGSRAGARAGAARSGRTSVTRSTPSSACERADHRPAERLGEVREAERQVARRLAARRVDEAERRAVEEEADRHAGLAEQALEPGVRAGAPAVVGRRGCAGRGRCPGANAETSSQPRSPAVSARIRDGVGRATAVSSYSGSATSSCRAAAAASGAGERGRQASRAASRPAQDSRRESGRHGGVVVRLDAARAELRLRLDARAGGRRTTPCSHEHRRRHDEARPAGSGPATPGARAVPVRSLAISRSPARGRRGRRARSASPSRRSSRGCARARTRARARARRAGAASAACRPRSAAAPRRRTAAGRCGFSSSRRSAAIRARCASRIAAHVGGFLLAALRRALALASAISSSRLRVQVRPQLVQVAPRAGRQALPDGRGHVRAARGALSVVSSSASVLSSVALARTA